MRFLLIPLLAAVFALLASAQNKPDAIEDRGYCFRLASPGKGWRLLEEKEIRRLAPDAVAGAVEESGRIGFVVVEPAITGSLDEAAELIQVGNDAENKQLVASTMIEFLHEPALRYQLEGNVDGTRYEWDSVVVIHAGFLYQITVGDTLADAHWSKEVLTPFQAAFTFLEGTPRVRRTASSQELTGVGWEIKEGIYRNAALGIEATARIPWRLIVGEELRKISDDAFIGFESVEPTLYVTLSAERGVGDELDSMAERERANFTGLLLGSETLTAAVLGKRAKLTQAHSDATPTFEYMTGFVQTREMIVKILAWYPRAQATKARSLLAGGLASTRLLGSREQTDLAQRLSAGPDVQNDVGPRYCLRNGMFQDFAAGFRWTKPAGFWRVDTGDAAHAGGDHISVVMQNEAAGLSCSVTVIEAQEPDLQNYFGVLTKSMLGQEMVASGGEPITLGEVPALHLSGTKQGKEPFVLDFTLAVTKERVIYITVSGTPGEVERNAEAVAAARKGLYVLSHPVKPVVATSDSVRDDRLGYALRKPGEGWRRKHITLGESDTQGSGTGWWKGKEEIDVVAVCPDIEGQTPDFIRDSISRSLPNTYATKDRTNFAESSETYLDASCKHASWDGEDGHVDLLYLKKGRTFYVLCARGPGPGDLELVEDCFSLVP